MSLHEQAISSLVFQVALSFDGAVLGIALAYAAIRSIIKLTSNSKALRKICTSPTFSVSDLRSLLPDQSHDHDQEQNQNKFENQSPTVVIVRGQVEAKSAVDGTWKSLRPGTSNVKESNVDFVVCVVKRIYNEWKGLFGWIYDLRAIFSRSWREKESTSLRTVRFVLVEGGEWPVSNYVLVNMDGSRHPLPLTTVFHQLEPIDASPYAFLQPLFGHEYPVGLLDEEKILSLSKEITAVGTLYFKNGIPEIKPCRDLPYFLSDMTKDQMVADLAFKTKILLWSGIVLGSLSIGILSYAVMRNWNRWKDWKQQRRTQQQNHSSSDRDVSQINADEEAGDVADEEAGDVPDGRLCVICLMRRRRSAFVPCGHLVCCQICAISVEREASRKCPLCQPAIRNSIRIFEC